MHTHCHVGLAFIVLFRLLGEVWNSMILSRPDANAKLLLHEEKAEYGGKIYDSVQESEDFGSFPGNSGIHFSKAQCF